MEILENKEGKDLAGGIKETVHRITEARSQYYRQCMVNVMFLYGQHHFSVSRHAADVTIGQRIAWEMESGRNKGSLRRTSNYILPLFRSAYSRLIRQKATVFAEATTQAQKDRDAAKISKEVAEEFWDNCNRNNIWMADDYSSMQSIMMKLILYKMTVGMGYLFPYFNPKAKSFVYDQARKDIIESDVGEAEVRVDSPFNVFKDRFGRFVIHRRFISPEQVEYEFDKEVEPSAVDEEAFETKIQRVLDGSEFEKLEKDGTYIYTKYCLPTPKEPEGRVYVCTETDVIYDSKLPEDCKGRIPCYEFKYQDLGFSRNSQGIIEQVVDLQQDRNFAISRIAQHMKMLTGKLLNPKKSGLTTQYNDIVGQIINYNQGHKPTMEPAPPVPAYFFEQLKRIDMDMENLMNSHDASMGRTPTQVKSGVGIANLSELDDAQIAPEMIMFEIKLGFFMEHILDICQFNYRERRLLDISGEDYAYEVKSFIGSDLMGHKRVKVKIGSNLPINKTDRTQYILMLKKEGFISPDRAKDMLEANDVEGAFTNLDEIGAKTDLMSIIEGTAEVIPEMFEDHTIYLKVINDFRKGNIYPRLPVPVREKINQFAEGHQMFLLAEMDAAKGMGGDLPPAAQPQMTSQQA